MNIVVVSQNGHLQRLLEICSLEEHRSLRDKFKDNLHIVFIPSAGMLDDSTLLQIRTTFGRVTVETWTWRSVWKRLNLSTRALHLQRYRTLLDQRDDIESVYLFAYLGHYFYLASLAKEKMIEVVLLEEGLATYSGLDVAHHVFESKFTEELKWQWQEFKQILKWGWQRWRSNIKVSPGGFREFDKAYLKFPHIGKRIFPESQIENIADTLPLTSGEIIGIPASQDEVSSALFVGQAYDFNCAEYLLLFKILVELTSKEILIKCHPRLKEKNELELQEALRLLDDSRLRIINLNLTSEEVVQSLGISEVFSLTSSTLLYLADKLNINCVSIAPVVLSNLDSIGENARLSPFVKDLELFVSFVKHSQLDIQLVESC